MCLDCGCMRPRGRPRPRRSARRPLLMPRREPDRPAPWRAAGAAVVVYRCARAGGRTTRGIIPGRCRPRRLRRSQRRSGRRFGPLREGHIHLHGVSTEDIAAILRQPQSVRTW